MNTPAKRNKSEEKRRLMIEAAGDLFLDKGFEGTSMDQVAQAAGVSKQTVYSHFGCKEELFSAMIEHKCRAHHLTDELFNTERPIHDVLQELAEHFSELLMSTEGICIFRVAIADAAQRGQAAELFWRAAPQRLTAQFRGYLIEQKRLGKINIDNPHFAAQQFLYMLKGEAYLQRALGMPDGTDTEELPLYIESCVELFEKAYLN